MFRKLLLVALGVVAAGGVAVADPARALLTHENKYPALGEVEVGGLLNITEYETRDEQTISAYGRYQFYENFILNVSAPYVDVEPEFGESNSGLGDVEIGLDLRAYEDIYGYPYVIPHVSVGLSTGDEDEGLGSGETVTTFGVSVGTVTYDVLHWILDASYAVDGGPERPDPENVFSGSLSIIWDVSKRFAVHGEARAEDQSTDEGDDDVHGIFLGGFTYKVTPDFIFGAYGGAGTDGVDNEDSIGIFKASYTF